MNNDKEMVMKRKNEHKFVSNHDIKEALFGLAFTMYLGWFLLVVAYCGYIRYMGGTTDDATYVAGIYFLFPHAVVIFGSIIISLIVIGVVYLYDICVSILQNLRRKFYDVDHFED